MIDQVTAVLENRPGRLSEILKTLADVGSRKSVGGP